MVHLFYPSSAFDCIRRRNGKSSRPSGWTVALKATRKSSASVVPETEVSMSLLSLMAKVFLACGMASSKHYSRALSPGDAKLEIGKILWYSFNGEYGAPRSYTFVAPCGIGTKLNNLLKNNPVLKSDLIGTWDKVCRKEITDTQEIPLESDFLQYVQRFDFSIFRGKQPLTIIEEHRSSPFHLARFGGGFPARPKAMIPPSDIDTAEIAPNLRAMRQTYGELADKKAEVREALGLYRALKDLEDRKTALEAEGGISGGNTADTDLPSSSIDRFSTLILDMLKEWHFPNVQRVHFDQRLRDLVIDGKNRTSFGKGLRAITQSAFSIGLLQYCRQQMTPHPGFVILDSPLLSYKEPDGDEDDLRHTDLKARFYQYLEKIPIDQQVIIIENTDPPPEIQGMSQAIKFTGILGDGRAGLFGTANPT